MFRYNMIIRLIAFLEPSIINMLTLWANPMVTSTDVIVCIHSYNAFPFTHLLYLAGKLKNDDQQFVNIEFIAGVIGNGNNFNETIHHFNHTIQNGFIS